MKKCLLFFCVTWLGLAAQDAVDPVQRWVASYKEYLGQQKIPEASGYRSQRQGSEGRSLSELLNELPEPEKWPALRQRLTAEARNAGAGGEMDALSLKAGSWLMGFLSGDRDTVKTELRELLASHTDKESQLHWSSMSLLRSLGEAAGDDGSLAEECRQFEEQLKALRPLVESEVVKAVGGKENFSRLQRLSEANAKLQKQFFGLIEEARDSEGKNDEMIRQKIGELQAAFEKENHEDIEALREHFPDPLVQRFLGEANNKDGEQSRHVPAIVIPDLLKGVGKERTEQLIREALRTRATLMGNLSEMNETWRLARSIAESMVEEMAVAQWGLVQGLDIAGLFEAMQKKFGPGGADNYAYDQAAQHYVVSLINAGRVAEAVSFAVELKGGMSLSLPYDMVSKLEASPEKAVALWEFLRGWLMAKPETNEWDRLFRLSAALGRKEEVKKLINAIAANQELRGAARLRVLKLQADGDLAVDDLPSGASRLRQIFDASATDDPSLKDQYSAANVLLQLQLLLADNAAAEATVAEIGQRLLSHDRRDFFYPSAAALLETLSSFGQYEMAARQGRELVARMRALPMPTKESPYADVPGYALKQILTELACAESQLGNHAAVEELLQNDPWWETSDLAQLLGAQSSGKSCSVAIAAARARFAAGDTASARKILEAQLVATPASDPAYAAYLKVTGREALPLLAKLEATDRYQERPLIWRARLLMDAGEWDAAIKTLERAIAIDPSDGEEGRGDRMRVYAFMGECHAAKGDKAKAEFFAKVIQAIRLSETADRWHSIGAYTRAIRMYREALTYFQDAYCIQSRLALRLMSEGRKDEAAQHFRRAFELMPDSFGRVESHCFGCEKIFEAETSQYQAETVFSRLLATQEGKPQLHYLMGYLREEQKRHAEAAAYYRKAVELDPLYLNAWSRLAGLGEELKMTPAEQDEIRFKLYLLDPAGRHTYGSLDRVADLRRLWHVLREGETLLRELPRHGALGELKASAALRKSIGTEGDEVDFGVAKDFATLMLQQNFVGALQRFIIDCRQPVTE